MSNSSDLRNYNVAFEIFLDAIDQYSKFVTGLDSGLFRRYDLEQTQKFPDQEDEESKKFLTSILDRTVGAHSFLGMEDVLKTVNLTDKRDLILSCYSSGTGDINHNQTFENESLRESGTLEPEDSLISIYDVVNTNFKKIDPKLTALPEDFINQATRPSEVHRFEKPTLSAHVIRKSQYSPTNRQARHLPIFLNAISDIEMSRCTPYLDVKCIHPRNLAAGLDIAANPKMSYTRLFRFAANDTFDNTTPLNSNLTDVSEIGLDSFSYMNLFTSPQTMVNADINSSNNSFSNITAFSGEDEDERPTSKNVLDPFQPLLSLISFDVTESGGGKEGFMSSKRASLKIKLHDKSRMADISPLIAVNEFALTYFSIEFGWSHPDSKLTSDNTIGKYINNLRSINNYSLIGSSYSFGKDNTVDITLELVTKGASHIMPLVSAYSGYYQNIGVFKGVINTAIGVMEGPSGEKNIRKRRDLLTKVRQRQQNLSSLSRLTPFENLKKIKAMVDQIDASNITKDIEEFYKDLKTLLNEGSQDTNGETIDPGISDKVTGFFASPGDVFESKWASLDSTPDPFTYASRFEDVQTSAFWRDGSKPPHDSFDTFYSNPQMPHITLGKLITKFVAFPLSTCGIYDEVQVYFYPVNHHAAGARRHTTASLPIDQNLLKEQIDKKISSIDSNENPNAGLAVNGFIALCQNILRRKEISAYGLQETGGTHTGFPADNIKKGFLESSHEEKIEFLTSLDAAAPSSPTGAIEDELWQYKYTPTPGASPEVESEEEQEAINKFLKGIEELGVQSLANKLSSIYGPARAAGEVSDDGVSLLARGSTFQPIDLQVFFEVTPIVDEAAIGESVALDSFSKILKNIKGEDILNIDGLLTDRVLLRIHIFDSNTLSNSDPAVLGLDTNEDGAIIEGSETDSATSELMEEARKNKNNFDFWKSILNSKFPTITHGQSSSVIKSIDINSNVPSNILDAYIVDAYEQRMGKQTAEEAENQWDEATFFPSNVSIQMMGNPMINRGTVFFVDFMTKTNLDNLYATNQVTHTIAPGNFTTTLSCLPYGQGRVSAARNNMLKKIDDLAKS